MPTRAVQGRRRTHVPAAGPASQPRRVYFRGSPEVVHGPTRSGAAGAEPLWKTAHERIPTERVRLRASPSGFQPRPFVPGLFWFRARVILLTARPQARRAAVRPGCASGTDRRVRFRGSLCVARSQHSRPLNRLLCPGRQTKPIFTRLESVGQAGTPNAKKCVWEPDPPYAEYNCAKQTQFDPASR